MKKMINRTRIEGYIYEHKLTEKTAGENAKNPGVVFINGSLSVATDDTLTNIIPVYFTYVTPVTKQGKPNATYNILKSIMDGKIGNVIEHGKENAGMVRVDSAVALNDWYDAKNNDQLISQRRNEGGFVHQINELNPDENQRATFDVDIVLTKATRIDEDSERGIPEHVNLYGGVFSFNGTLLPIDLTVRNPNAMNYFESLGISSSNPCFTELRGVQVSRTITIKKEEEGAWGTSVTETTRSDRNFIVNWAKPAPYDWDDESTITAAELDEANQKRQISLAEKLQAHKDYQASKGGAFTAAPTTGGSGKVYNF